ncbi:putative eka-like protein [Erysiphe necator]|uniref:Putative eka-like protein n=1 Tax=Uncinula necator TaxID=52586 RepID=A0A0B1P244_UNCNE|nr:putative eka-like protein [Erysiphe necator]
MHSQSDCKAYTNCKNYRDPHRSDSYKRLSRPSRYGEPTEEQLKSFRIIGERQYQAVARAKAAEKRATAITDSIIISSSHSPKPSSSDIQQTPIEAPLGKQMRL